jgi:hypothetical protein
MLRSAEPEAVPRRLPETTFDPYQNSSDSAAGQAPVLLPEDTTDEHEELNIDLTDLLPEEGAGMRDGGLPGSNSAER